MYSFTLSTVYILSILVIECNFNYSYNYLQVKEYDIFTLIKVHYSQFFVQNFVFLMNPICIQVVIKHEHMKIESNSLFFV